MTPRLTLVAALARDRVIGRGNALPWRLPEDLKHFKSVTMGRPLIMGRKTFDSIGRPLPGRRSIVVTRDPAWLHPGCERADSIDQALAMAARGGGDADAPAVEEVIVAGGAEIYRQTIANADRLLLTEIDLTVEGGDAHFPAIDSTRWRQAARAAHRSADGLDYAFVEYLRS